MNIFIPHQYSSIWSSSKHLQTNTPKIHLHPSPPPGSLGTLSGLPSGSQKVGAFKIETLRPSLELPLLFQKKETNQKKQKLPGIFWNLPWIYGSWIFFHLLYLFLAWWLKIEPPYLLFGFVSTLRPSSLNRLPCHGNVSKNWQVGREIALEICAGALKTHLQVGIKTSLKAKMNLKWRLPTSVEFTLENSDVS